MVVPPIYEFYLTLHFSTVLSSKPSPLAYRSVHTPHVRVHPVYIPEFPLGSTMLLIELQYFRDGIKTAGVDGVCLEPPLALQSLPADIPPNGVLPVEVGASQAVQFRLSIVDTTVHLAIVQQTGGRCLPQEPVLAGGVQIRDQEEVFPFTSSRPPLASLIILFFKDRSTSRL